MSTERTPPLVVWTIAGFDPSSGAGITADLLTFAAHGVFGCSAITALTVQSTMGASEVHVVPPSVVRSTLDVLAADLPPVGIKIGMLANGEIAQVIAGFLRALPASAETPRLPVVLDPVLRSSSGRELYPAADLGVLHAELLPHVTWTTPNWTELAALADSTVASLTDAEHAGRRLQERHPQLNLAVTGGDQREPTDLLLIAGGEAVRFRGEHVATRSTHGTGCAFSSALLANLVRGAAPTEAVREAKAYVTGALRHAPGLGGGRGPLGLLWPLHPHRS